MFAGLYSRVHGRSRPLTTGAVLLALFCALIAANAVVREDVTSLMPTSPPELAEQFAVLRESPMAQSLTITVGGTDPAQGAALLAKALRGPAIPVVTTGLDALSPSLLARFCASAPGLMDRETVAVLPDLVTEEAITRSLRNNVKLLMTPRGIALRELLAMDPLGVCGTVMKRLIPRHGPGSPGSPGSVGDAGGPNINLGLGQIMSRDGRYALILAEPAASMADSLAAPAVMDTVRTAVASLPLDLARGTEVIIAGGHRHTEDNAAVIKADVARVLPASVALLALAFAVFVRTREGLAIMVLPGAALAVAAAFTAVVYGSLSGIVLGFGSVVLGITTDYAIHVYYAVRSGRDATDSLSRVSRPLLLGAATTLAAFVAFFSSSIPCIVQMTWFAVCGVVTAAVLALVVLPHCLTTGADAGETPGPRGIGAPAATPAAPMRPRRFALVLFWAVLAVALALAPGGVPVNGDIRALSHISDEIARDEARTKEIWGGLRERAMIAVRGDTVEQALFNNDRLWAALNALPDAGGAEQDTGGMVNLAAILPSETTQRARHAAWNAFWDRHRDETLARVERLAPEAGFSAGAFAPFRRWIAGDAPLITPQTFADAGLTLPLALIRAVHGGNGTSHLVYSLITAGSLSPEAMKTLRDNGAIHVSGHSFREALADATRADLIRFGSLSLALILGMSAWALRSPVRMGMALLPVAAGMACVLTAFRLMGMSLNIFHAMALPLVMALSVDYGIFILAHLEGRLGRECRKAVLLSGLTTLSGFGVLMLADHPALFSLGFTVTLGLGAALTTALILLPRLAEPVAVEENPHVRT